MCERNFICKHFIKFSRQFSLEWYGRHNTGRFIAIPLFGDIRSLCICAVWCARHWRDYLDRRDWKFSPHRKPLRINLIKFPAKTLYILLKQMARSLSPLGYVYACVIEKIQFAQTTYIKLTKMSFSFTSTSIDCTIGCIEAK